MSAHEYKNVSCGVCDSTDQSLIYPDLLQGKTPNFDYNFSPNHSLTYQTVRCLNCSHVYSSPLPVDIWKNYVSVIDQMYLRNQNSRLATSKVTCKALKKFAPGGKLLDIGCASGDFLSVAQEFYSVEGLELSEWSAQLARAKGYKIHSKFLSEFDQNGSYDVMTLWGVIEHFEHPRQEVKDMLRLLKPGGIVALWTGDVNGLCSKVLGKKWWHIQGQHIQDFTQRSLTMLFERAGFTKEWIGVYPYVMSRDAIVQSLGRYPGLMKVTSPIIKKVFSPKFNLTISLPGEMFAVFRKPSR